MNPRNTRTAIILALALFASYAYFYQAGGWNQNSRFALVRAILERHTLQIDAYQLHTGDRAVWHGHYYSDKAPGASLLALLPVAAARFISRVAGVDPESFPGIAWTSYVAAVVSSALFTTIAALAVFWLSLRWGATRNAALFAATAYGIASPAWAYATLFMGHGQAAGCLMIAFVAGEILGSSPLSDRNESSPEASKVLRVHGVLRGGVLNSRAAASALALIFGIAGAWAVVTEFQAAVPAVLIGIMLLARRRDEAKSIRSILAPIAIGIVIAAMPLFVYNALAFDSPLHLGYSSEEGFKELQSGFFGITYPKLSTLRELLTGSYRGLLPIAPLYALAPFGLIRLARRGHAGPAIVAALTGLYYLLLNASYFFWEGGWAYGPRQVMTAMPFVALGLAPLWDIRSRSPRKVYVPFFRVVLVAAWIWGAAINLVAVSTTPQPPSNVKAPVRELLWPAFREGDLSLNHQTFVHRGADPARLRGGSIPHAAWNLGEILGLRGLPSLLPLVAVWIAAIGFLAVLTAQDVCK